MNPLPYGRGSDFAGAAAKTPAAQTALQRQLDASARQIDRLAHHLYALTPEEIKIVEEATVR